VGKFAAKPSKSARTRKRVSKRRISPAQEKNAGLMRYYGAIPGMEQWALDELKRMRDAW